MVGRGSLGRWGPNHAADPVVTRLVLAVLARFCLEECLFWHRWKLSADGTKLMHREKPILEFVAIKRKDTGNWAIPGV